MAVKGKRKRWRSRHGHGPGDRHEHQRELAARLAPLEETQPPVEAGQGGGNGAAAPDTIRVGRSNVKMPEQFAEDERSAAGTFRLDAVVVVILAAVLAFIGFVAWQITLMPPPAR